MGRKDAVGKFCQETCGLRLAGAGGNIVCITADGTVLGARRPNLKGIRSDPKKAIDDWNALSAGRRKPGNVKVESKGPDDSRIIEHSPPPGGLVVKQYYRMLADDNDELRHIVLKDFDHHERLSKYRDPEARRHYYEAAPDYLWLSKQEWKSLIPENPRKGDREDVAPIIAQRIFRFHLVPDITFGESNGWRREQVRSGQLTTTVEEATSSRIRLRLDGSAQLGLDFDTAQTNVKEGKHSCHGFEPALLGYIEFDKQQQRITRFDLVALGDFYGHLYGDNRWLFRTGRTPLGVAFHLVTEQSPAFDRQVTPRAMRIGFERYFTVK
jgi:hypothetical protein